ncbi:hypothetical protein [Streptomyces sp. NPDC006290]
MGSSCQEEFRFGHSELKHLDAAEALLQQFLPDMFRRFKPGT